MQSTTDTPSAPAGQPVTIADVKFDSNLWLSPNDFLRSALFGIFKRDRPQLAPGASLVLHDFPTFKLTLWGGPPSDIEGPYGTSEQVVAGAFDQTDHEVFMALLHESEGVIGAPRTFHAYTLLEKLGRKGTGAANAQVLHNSLARLSRTHVIMKFTPNGAKLPITYSGLLLSTIFNPDTGTYSVAIDGNIQKLMSKSNYSATNWDERLALRSPLAKWLHGFYSSHAEPLPLEVESLHARTGSKATLKEFRRTLKTALDELEEKTEMSGRVNAKDCLVVARGKISRMQRKAVVRKARRCKSRVVLVQANAA